MRCTEACTAAATVTQYRYYLPCRGRGAHVQWVRTIRCAMRGCRTRAPTHTSLCVVSAIISIRSVAHTRTHAYLRHLHLHHTCMYAFIAVTKVLPHKHAALRLLAPRARSIRAGRGRRWGRPGDSTPAGGRCSPQTHCGAARGWSRQDMDQRVRKQRGSCGKACWGPAHIQTPGTEKPR